MLQLGGFSNGAGNSIKDLTDIGKRQLAETMELKKYLLDFWLIKEHGVSETICKSTEIYSL
ncbi:MAG: hypothetical protein PUB42_03915 [Firmicutes bacterium]|nr:hypothetical protein [Bacillota bacterium]